MSSTNFKLSTEVNHMKKGELSSPFLIYQVVGQVFMTPPFKIMEMRINMMMAKMPWKPAKS